MTISGIAQNRIVQSCNEVISTLESSKGGLEEIFPGYSKLHCDYHG